MVIKEHLHGRHFRVTDLVVEAKSAALCGRFSLHGCAAGRAQTPPSTSARLRQLVTKQHDTGQNRHLNY